MHKCCLMYKMVNKLAPCFLCNLCPAFVNERSIAIAFVWEVIFVCLMFRPKGIGNLFFFHHLSCGIVFLLKFANPLLLVVLKIMFEAYEISTSQLVVLHGIV